MDSAELFKETKARPWRILEEGRDVVSLTAVVPFCCQGLWLSGGGLPPRTYYHAAAAGPGTRALHSSFRAARHRALLTKAFLLQTF